MNLMSLVNIVSVTGECVHLCSAPCKEEYENSEYGPPYDHDDWSPSGLLRELVEPPWADDWERPPAEWV